MALKLPDQEQLKQLLSGATEKIFVVLVVAYVAVSVSRSVMKNYEINQKIDALEQQLVDLDQQSLYLDSMIAYYKTNTFKELKAREELGLHSPGENVISVPLEEEDIETDTAYLAVAPDKSKEKPLPNYERWLHYFFGA
jgi:cell division protein FtsB